MLTCITVFNQVGNFTSTYWHITRLTLYEYVSQCVAKLKEIVH